MKNGTDSDAKYQGQGKSTSNQNGCYGGITKFPKTLFHFVSNKKVPSGVGYFATADFK